MTYVKPMGVGTTLIPTLQMKTKEVKRLAQGRTLAEAVFKPQPFDLSPQAPTLYLIASQIKKKKSFSSVSSQTSVSLDQ